MTKNIAPRALDEFESKQYPIVSLASLEHSESSKSLENLFVVPSQSIRFCPHKKTLLKLTKVVHAACLQFQFDLYLDLNYMQRAFNLNLD